MHIQDLSGKNICIIGFGKEGRAMAEALELYAKGCKITIADRGEEVSSKKYVVRSGDTYLDNLNDFDVIIKSPGIPPHLLTTHYSLQTNRSLLTTPTQIFFDTVAESGSTIIGITGSKGKSTTASLLFAILKAAGENVYLVGNIGEPAIAHISDAKKDAIFVMEMSSYQLMDIKTSPQIALVTSFFPEHLDYHASTLLNTSGTPLKNYLDAKKNIARFQTEQGTVFYCEAFKEAKEIAMQSKGQKISFSSKDVPLKLDEILLKGTHNLENIAGALAVAKHLGIEESLALEIVKHFKNLPHRLETVAITGRIEWVNDSISTTPESAIAALDALGTKVSTIILGGQDRGYDFSILAKRLSASSVKTVIALPESGEAITKDMEKTNAHIVIKKAGDMKSAVTLAKESTKNGIVLLSPASPSYGHFKNFEDRGEQFKKYAERGGTSVPG